jgi:hypothetical protein
MPVFRSLTRRAGPLGLALTAWDLWRRLTPQQRKHLMNATRKHGPKLAKLAAERARTKRQG